MALPMQYPVFEADQVLTNKHLNDAFNYLDAQNRLTRTHLIGIGIVCGLELNYNQIDALTISRGCGVTSLGLLILFEKTTTYKFARKITLPKTFTEQNALTKIYETLSPWELSDTQQSGDDVLSPAFLDDKVMMLLLEADLLDLKNCDTTDCSDKGKRMDFILRPLLITISDAEKLARGNGKIPVNLLDSRFALPDLHLRRFDVTATILQTPKDILTAFGKLMDDTTVSTVSDTLQLAYNTFKPILYEDFSGDFSQLKITLTQTRDNLKYAVVCQYVFDWIDDLVKTYTEIHEKGTECLTLCCPDEALFPYHLLLGRAIFSTTDLGQNINLAPFRIFRNYFIHSPIVGCNDALVAGIRSLFKRLVLLIKNFGNTQTNNTNSFAANISRISPIRITPSKLGDVPLSDKAIPYYYSPVPLYQYWNYDKTRRYKADTNLGYRADLYSTSPAIRTPLLFDIEAYNFLRIEGHIGLNYQRALGEIVLQIQQYRLPVQVIALKAKKFDELDIDYTLIRKSLSDLEITYDVVRREWEAIIGQNIEWLDDNKNDANQAVGTAWLRTFIGHLVTSKRFMFNDLSEFIAHYRAFIRLYEMIEADADSKATELRQRLANNDQKLNAVFAEDLIDHLDEIGLSIAKGPFRALYQDYRNRVIELLKMQYFEYYSQIHPGLEHKAGVVKGGTFILVYADSARQITKRRVAGNIGVSDEAVAATTAVNVEESDDCDCFEDSFNERFKGIDDPVKRKTILELLGNDFFQPVVEKEPEIADGIVFADFYLPYLCCGDGPGITYILETPKEPVKPTLSIDPVIFCSNDQKAYTPVTSPEGGVLKANGQVVANNVIIPVTLGAGTFTLTYEADGQTSDPVTIIIKNARTEAIKIEASTHDEARPGDEITFTILNPVEGETYNWDFGDGTTATGNPVSHKYSLSENEQRHIFRVRVNAQNAPCSGSDAETEIIVQQPESDVIFEIEQLIYCWQDDKMFCFKVDEQYQNNSQIENPGGLIFTDEKEACFVPRNQIHETTKTFDLTYRGKQLSITIVKPNANYTIKLETTVVTTNQNVLITLNAKDQTHLLYQWKIAPFDVQNIPNKPSVQIQIPLNSEKFLETIRGNNGELIISLTAHVDLDSDSKPDCDNTSVRVIKLDDVSTHLENKDEF